MKRSEQPVFHYTDSVALAGMMRTGSIVASDRVLTPGCPPVVWLSAAREWELISMASTTLGIDHELSRLGPDQAGRAVRIEIDRTSVVGWVELLAAHGASTVDIFAAEQAGLSWLSNPDDWFVVQGDVPVTGWLGVEIWNGNTWKRAWKHRQREMRTRAPSHVP